MLQVEERYKAGNPKWYDDAADAEHVKALAAARAEAEARRLAEEADKRAKEAADADARKKAEEEAAAQRARAEAQAAERKRAQVRSYPSCLVRFGLLKFVSKPRTQHLEQLCEWMVGA